MNRRGFLGSIAAFAAQCTLDPELALWKPGAKLISIPKPQLFRVGMVGTSSHIAAQSKLNRLTLDELEEHYFKPAREAIQEGWRHAEMDGTAWWVCKS